MCYIVAVMDKGKYREKMDVSDLRYLDSMWNIKLFNRGFDI